MKNWTNCLAALQNICQEFELEFEVIQNIEDTTNTINIKAKVGAILPFIFEYGYKNGLYSLTRDRVSDGQVTTRLYPYGSSENIPTNYRNFSPRLKLPTSYGKDYIQDDAKVALYGLNEEIINYDDIKPTFKGVLSGVGSVINLNNTFDIVVGNMDFDLNEKKPDGSTKYLIAGTPAKLHVNKGNLAGYEFEIHSYDHATKKFQVKVQADERGQKFPDLATIFKFAVGDEIVLIDIILPQIYIDNAETKLKDKAIEDYAVKSQNNVKYSLDIDPMFLVELGYTEYTKIISIGDYAGIKDTQLSVDKSSRIVSLKRDLLNPFKYSADISDTYEIGLVTQIIQDIQNVQTQIQIQTQVNVQAMLSGYRRMLELQGLVFDTDGNFDMSHFAAGSITTNMLSVGARSQELTLKDVVFTPNKDGNVNNISISAGSLIHFSIDSAGVKTWDLSALNQTGLIASNSYYIYARVSRTGNTGTFVVTTEQRKFDQEDKYYNFLLGVLFQPQNGVRLIHLNYGATYINGRVITTGRIASIDGLNWFDLDTGEFRGKFIFTDGTNVQGAVNNAASAAAAAQATANNAINQINDIGSDNKLTPNEKQVLVNEWNRIKIEYSQNSTIASTLNLSIISYQSAYNALDVYITPLLANLTTTSDIVGSTFRANFQNYYNQNVAIVTAIENKKIENIQIGGRNFIIKSDFKINQSLVGWYAPNSHWFNDDSISIDYVPSGQAYYELSQSLISVDSDTEYTLSFFAKGEVSSDYDVQVYLVEGNATTPNIKDNFKVFKVNNSKYFLCSTTFKTSANTTKVSVIFRNIPSNNGTLFFKKPKLEKGNKATDWTPAPEDVQTQIDTNSTNTALALAQAQNAINTANNVAVITSFLQTSILGNVVATGTLLVGDVLGAKAGITGVTDRAGKSVRLFAGANYTGKNIANWNVLDDGTMNFHHPNGQIAFEFGLSNGRFVMNGYHESGYKIFELSPSRGLVNVAYIPESWTVVELFFSGQTNTILNESAAKDYIENLVRIEMTGGTEVGQEAFWNYLLDANFSCFDYQNGTHPDYTQYADLVGYKTINNNRNNNIDNGWYGLKTGSIDGNFGDSRPILYTNYILYYIYNGKITNTKIINLVI